MASSTEAMGPSADADGTINGYLRPWRPDISVVGPSAPAALEPGSERPPLLCPGRESRLPLTFWSGAPWLPRDAFVASQHERLLPHGSAIRSRAHALQSGAAFPLSRALPVITGQRWLAIRWKYSFCWFPGIAVVAVVRASTVLPAAAWPM